MKSRSYRQNYRRDAAARPASYASGFVIPRHGSSPSPEAARSRRTSSVSPDRARVPPAAQVPVELHARRIEPGSRMHGNRFDAVRFAEAMAKVASVVLTAGNGLLLTALFGN